MSNNDSVIRALEDAMPQSFWDSLISMPPGWEPPRLTIEDFAG